jgi:isocitrate dehydrogenase (NAD+)
MRYQITLIPGDGIGTEVSFAAKRVLDNLGLDIQWDIVEAGEQILKDTGKLVPQNVYESIEKNKIVLKGPITTPIGVGFRSINVHLRQKYDLYTNIRPIIDYKNKDLNFVIFRENTEGLYIGEEIVESVDSIIAIKRITRKGSTRIIRAAFKYAKANDNKKVTVAHKANILKKTDGLFLNVFREIAQEYDIETEEVIIDAMCMKLVMDPTQFDVIVTMNLYGDILSDLAAGLIGGLGLVPGANIGDDLAIFEAVHGSAPDIAGLGIANPIAMIRSSALMLEYLNETTLAKLLNSSVNKVLSEKVVMTKDLGGTATTDEITNEIIRKMVVSKV